jgi:hypothetical protein
VLEILPEQIFQGALVLGIELSLASSAILLPRQRCVMIR